MKSSLNKSQVEDLLINVLRSPKVMPWKGSKVQFCCPVHGESHPSAGIDIDFNTEDSPDGHFQVFHCFSCGESGTIPWLVYKSLPDRFSSVKQAADFLKKRYDVSYEYTADRKTGKIKRYDEPEEEIAHKRHELPKSFIAPFKSGKETYQYFFDRGFDKNDVKQFLIGRDLENETVTIPVFWEDDTLAGVIGRYIDKNRPKNMRYKIYNFPKGDLIFPLNKLQVINNTIIGVEGMLDVI